MSDGYLETDVPDGYMQIANFRQGVISPLDDESCVVKNDTFEGTMCVAVDYLQISSYGGFDTLHDKRFFDLLNEECGFHLADNENEYIPPEKLDQVIKTLKKHQNEFTREYTKVFTKMLIDLVTSAKERGHPVIFIL